MSQRRVLILYTGGTFGMEPGKGRRALKTPRLSEAGLVSRFRRHVPELDSVARTRVEILMNCDSAHIGPQDWVEIADRIKKRWNQYDGFVVLHGTDTLAYTASALSFLLRPCKKPVVLTGAQRPLASVRTDARRNLVSAVELAASGRSELGRQVSIFFDDQLFQGNRTRKRSAQDFRGFESPQAPAIADVGAAIRFHAGAASRRLAPRAGKMQDRFSERVPLLHVTPGFPSALIREQLLPSVDGLVLVIFQSGTAPTHDAEFIALLREARRLGKPIVSVTESRTEFPGQRMKPAFYEAAKRMTREGALSAGDLTPECAWVKASWLLAQPHGAERFADRWKREFAGEGGPLRD